MDKIMQENKISSPLSLESALNFVPLIIESSVYKHLWAPVWCQVQFPQFSGGERCEHKIP